MPRVPLVFLDLPIAAPSADSGVKWLGLVLGLLLLVAAIRAMFGRRR